MAISYYKRDLHKARLFSNTFLFTDYMCSINDHLKFDKIFKIFELQLKKEIILIFQASFLDVSIKIKNKEFKA